MTDSTITDRETLYETLDEIRERGYAVNDGGKWRGSAPSEHRFPTGTNRFSVRERFGPKTRHRRDQYYAHVSELVMRTANVIGVNLNMVERSKKPVTVSHDKTIAVIPFDEHE